MDVFFANLKVAPYLAVVAGEEGVVVLEVVTAENIGLNTGVNCQAGVAAGARVPGRGAVRDTAVSSRKGGSVEAGAAASSEKKCWGRYSGLARDSSGLGLGGRVLTVMITCRESVTSGRHVTKYLLGGSGGRVTGALVLVLVASTSLDAVTFAGAIRVI